MYRVTPRHIQSRRRTVPSYSESVATSPGIMNEGLAAEGRFTTYHVRHLFNYSAH